MGIAQHYILLDHWLVLRWPKILMYEAGVATSLRCMKCKNASGRFTPLPAPFPLCDLPLRSRSIVFCHAHSTLRSAPPDFRPAPLRFPFRSRIAHMLWIEGRAVKTAEMHCSTLKLCRDLCWIYLATSWNSHRSADYTF